MMNRALDVTDDRREGEEEPQSTEPSAGSAVERAVEAAQRIAVERFELMRLETLDSLMRVAKGSGLMLAGGLIVILGLAGLAAALVVVLAERMPLATSLAIVAGGHALAGIALGLTGATIAGRKTP